MKQKRTVLDRAENSFHTQILFQFAEESDYKIADQ
jgi:hypothetical protein